MITNRHNLPQALVRALERDAYDSAGSDATVSSLHEPPRVVLLRQAHKGELSADVSERLNALLGTAFHKVMELAAGPGDVVEKRYHATIRNWDVSGQVDLYEPEPGILTDWKVLSVWSVVVGDAIDDYTKRQNTYARLIRANSGKIAKLKLLVLFRDWSAREARNDPNYPQQQAIEYELPLWPADVAETYVEGLVEKHQNATIGFERDGELLACTAAEKWEKPTRYALTKIGAKRATKVFDSLGDAEAAMGSGFTIDKRPGEMTRCMFFCPVKDHCEVGKALQLAAEEAF